MTLTDSELCMLEQLTYLTGDRAEIISDALGIDYCGLDGNDLENQTISQILSCFTEDVLAKLEALGDTDLGDISAKEWAQIIRYLKTSKMSSLVLSDTMVNSNGVTIALCFVEDVSSDEAIVAFRGTVDGDEWVDNVEGLNTSDTDCQKEALDYIEGLPYGSITVTGHSKGGNKAMYVAITSDKVTRCVAFDGQGFSAEFLDKYWAEIEEKAGNIKCYSLSTDFVHILMYYIPGAEQIYCAGYGVEDVAENHSFNSFFATDEDGNLILDEDGSPTFTITSEDEALTTLHEFTTFILNNASDEDKQLIVEFVSVVLTKAMCGEADDLLSFITDSENQEALVAIIAYLSKFMAENDISGEYVCDLLDALGVSEVYEKYTYNILGKEVNIIELLLAAAIDNTVVKLNDQLNDNDAEPFLTWALEKLGLTDISELWEKINSKVKSIDASDSSSGLSAKSGSIRDFSKNTYTAIMSAINQIENIGDCPVSSWKSYSGEDWYSSLLISTAVKGMSAYFSKLTKTNETCKTRIESIFSEVWALDASAGNKLEKVNSSLKKINKSVTSMAGEVAA